MKINNAISSTKIPGTTWLQGIGHVYGKKAAEIIIGDILAWNYGQTSTVKSISRITDKFVEIITIYDGKEYTRRLKKDRIVALA